MSNQAGKSRRSMRRILGASLAIIVVMAVVILGIAGYAASSLTRFERVPVENTPADFGIEYVDVEFPSRDGLMLRGWWLEGEEGEPVIVVVHGSEGNRAHPTDRNLGIASGLVDHGYNVLMFDMRGHGESEGKHISAGYHEKHDVLGAIDYIRQTGIQTQIGVLGLSMGAAASLMAAAESEEIAAVVADGGYADIISIFESEFSARSSLPGFFIPIILFAANKMYDIDFAAIKPEEAVSELSVPVFIIHGEQDDMVPVAHAYRLREASRHPDSRLWILPEAAHSNAYLMRPAEYTERVIAFFDEALN